MLLHGGKAVDQMPHPAGDLLCAERRVSGKQLIVFRIPLQVHCVHGAKRIAQPRDLRQQRGYSLDKSARFIDNLHSVK